MSENETVGKSSLVSTQQVEYIPTAVRTEAGNIRSVVD